MAHALRDTVKKHFGGVQDDSHASRFSEAALMAALIHKYGTDEVDRLARQVPNSKTQLVEYAMLPSTAENPTGASVRRAAQESYEIAGVTVDDAEGVDPAQRMRQEQLQQLEGGPLISQLVLNHLQQVVGLADVAEVFQQELQTYGYPRTFFMRESSPLPLPKFDVPGMPTSLGQLLCPAVETRDQILILLSDAERKIFDADANGHRRDDVTLQHLLGMIETPIWAAHNDSVLAYTHPTTRHIRAGTLNQLVERTTDISIHPNVSVKQAKLEADDKWMHCMIRTHRHFTSSHVLLAKLLERFFVPSFLPLAELYDDHGIYISNPPHQPVFAVGGPLHPKMSQRALYWIEVTRRIQIKVCCFISLWLDAEPQHFDDTMVSAVETWMEECLYTPALWSEAPLELAQCAESIKLALKRRLEKNNSSDQGGFTLGGGGGGGGGGYDEMNGAPGATADDRTSRRIGRNEETVDILFSRHRAEVGALESNRASSFSTRIPQQSLLSGVASLGSFAGLTFLAVDDIRLANQITAIDHVLLRRIHYNELYIYATNNGARSLHSTNHPAMHLHAFLRRGEELMHWIITELIRPRGTASKSGSAQGAATPPPSSSTPPATAADEETPEIRPILYQKFVALMFRLLDMNNIHSAMSVLCALRHPVVTRISSLHEAITPSVREAVLDVERQFNFARGYAGYKAYIKGIPDTDVYPVIPLLTVWIDELRRITCTEPSVLRDTRNGGLIHWRKYEVIGTIYDRLVSLQKKTIPSEFQVIPACVRWLNDRYTSGVHDPERLLEYSLLVEPRRIQA